MTRLIFNTKNTKLTKIISSNLTKPCVSLWSLCPLWFKSLRVSAVKKPVPCVHYVANDPLDPQPHPHSTSFGTIKGFAQCRLSPWRRGKPQGRERPHGRISSAAEKKEAVRFRTLPAFTRAIALAEALKNLTLFERSEFVKFRPTL